MIFSEEIIRERLRDVIDPELHINIVDLGLIYGIEIDGDSVRVTYTLTSPGCPLGPHIAAEINEAVRDIPGVRNVELDLTFTPHWEPTMASEDARMEMGIW